MCFISCTRLRRQVQMLYSSSIHFLVNLVWILTELWMNIYLNTQWLHYVCGSILSFWIISVTQEIIIDSINGKIPLKLKIYNMDCHWKLKQDWLVLNFTCFCWSMLCLQKISTSRDNYWFNQGLIQWMVWSLPSWTCCCMPGGYSTFILV